MRRKKSRRDGTVAAAKLSSLIISWFWSPCEKHHRGGARWRQLRHDEHGVEEDEEKRPNSDQTTTTANRAPAAALLIFLFFLSHLPLPLLLSSSTTSCTYFLPFWRQASCVVLVCTALILAVWLPHVLRSAVEELKRRRLENITNYLEQQRLKLLTDAPPTITTTEILPSTRVSTFPFTVPWLQAFPRQRPSHLVTSSLDTLPIPTTTLPTSTLSTTLKPTTTALIWTTSTTTTLKPTTSTSTTLRPTTTSTSTLKPTTTTTTTTTLKPTTTTTTTLKPTTTTSTTLKPTTTSSTTLKPTTTTTTTLKPTTTTTTTLKPTSTSTTTTSTSTTTTPSTTLTTSTVTTPRVTTTTTTKPTTTTSTETTPRVTTTITTTKPTTKTSTSTTTPKPTTTGFPKLKFNRFRLRTLAPWFRFTKKTTTPTTTSTTSTTSTTPTTTTTSTTTTSTTTTTTPVTTTTTSTTTTTTPTTTTTTTPTTTTTTTPTTTTTTTPTTTTTTTSTTTTALAKLMSKGLGRLVTVATKTLPALAVMSTLAPPATAYTMSRDGEYFPKMAASSSTDRITIAKLALALNRINNIPMKWCSPKVEVTFNFDCHRAVRNVGDIRILQRIVIDVVNGRKNRVTFGAVGGSVTAGHDVQHHQLYLNRMASILSRALDVPTVTQVSALPATGSEFFAFCIHKMLELRRFDIVAIEFGINDDRFREFMPGYQPDNGRPMEELVRQVLQYERIQPLLVNFRQVRTMVESYGYSNDPNNDPDCPSIEDSEFLPLAAYYAIPMISWKKVFCRSDLRENITQFVAPDGVHPNAMVHEQIGEFFSLLLKYAIEDLIGKLLSRYPTYAQPWNLPRPFTMETAPILYSSTWLQLRPICFINFRRPSSGFGTRGLEKNLLASRNATLIGTTGPLSIDEIFEFYELKGANSSVSYALEIEPPRRPDLVLILSIAYQTMGSCTRDGKLEILVSAKQSIFASDRGVQHKAIPVEMPIRCYENYNANMVDEVPFSHRQRQAITELLQLHGHLVVTVRKMERYYRLNLHAIVAGWHQNVPMPVI